MTIFIALTEYTKTPILLWLFQKLQAPPVHTFDLDGFTFNLVNGDDARFDKFHYVVPYENVSMELSLFGIDTVNHCESLSNIDLVYFMWDNFLRLSYKKFALALSPRSGDALLPELMFLRHYRFESDGWKDTSNCDA
jgi:hypothetical protein